MASSVLPYATRLSFVTVFCDPSSKMATIVNAAVVGNVADAGFTDGHNE